MGSRALIRCLRRYNHHQHLLEPTGQLRAGFGARGLLLPANRVPFKTVEEVVGELTRNVIGGPHHYDPDQYNKNREALLNILPESQAELPGRRMTDSYDAAIIPLGSDRKLRERYITNHGGVRVGRLLEDMDIFAVHLVFKHVVNPRQTEGMSR